MNRKKWLVDLLMLMLFIVGIGAIAYPFVSDKVSDIIDQQLINYYQGQANRENQEEMDKIQAEMEEKNKAIAENNAPGVDPYSELDADAPREQAPLTFYQEHTIGVVTIPSINVRLPIFDQTLPVFLEKGASLLEGSSYPTGGENTHSVLTSHAGIMQAKLFTDLEKMEAGDQFFVEINNQTLAYEVDQIKVVLPHETEDVKVIEGGDYVTLLTCTPYMINTHRLLVRGHRIPYVPETAEPLEQVTQTQQLGIFVTGSVVLALIALVAWIFYRIIFNTMISRRTYDVNLQLLDTESQPLSQVSLIVLNTGKQPVVGRTNGEGEVQIKELPGGKYRLENSEKDLSLQIYIKQIKDKTFSVKLKTKLSKWEEVETTDQEGVKFKQI